jgi:opacity protein-like surface antigen
MRNNMLRTMTIVALMASPLAMQAQRASARAAAPMNDRAGYSLSLGLGGGSSTYTCAGCQADRENGASGYLRVGKGFTPSMMLGLELNGWNKTENNVTGRNGMLSAIAQWYPSMTNGFFAKGGLGLARTTIDDRTGTAPDKIEATGFGYQVGAGYDMSIARRWAITPYINFLGAPDANAKLNGVDAGQKLGSNYVQYGLGLSWH